MGTPSKRGRLHNSREGSKGAESFVRRILHILAHFSPLEADRAESILSRAGSLDPVPSLFLIHRSAWKVNSAKSRCSILHRPPCYSRMVLCRSTSVRLIDGKELADWLEGLREDA